MIIDDDVQVKLKNHLERVEYVSMKSLDDNKDIWNIIEEILCFLFVCANIYIYLYICIYLIYIIYNINILETEKYNNIIANIIEKCVHNNFLNETSETS